MHLVTKSHTKRKLPLIAVVDDDDSVRRALKRMLSADGRFEVALFTSGAELLRSPDGTTADCLILDYQIPGSTAPMLQRKLTAAGIAIPVIVVTANDDPRRRRACLNAGALAYLVKPISRERLLTAVLAAIARSKTE